MRKLATTLALAALLAIPATAWAQVNQSVVYARDVAGATMTLDGNLTEAAWQDAERIELKWNQDAGGYSSGQQIEGTPTLAEPSDPIDATIYLLRDGNKLWIGIDAKDQSIGGNTGFFPWDGLIMAMQDKTTMIDPNANGRGGGGGGGIAEFIYSFRREAGDTTSTGAPTPGLMPIAAGPYADRTNPRNVAIFDFDTEVDGISNDDNLTDVGYTMELTIAMDSLGYDFDKAGGDLAGASFAIQDLDFPRDDNNRFTSRVFWESKWGNTFWGVGYIAGEPGVTVNSGDNGTITVGPDFTISKLSAAGVYQPTIDGMLDEAFWSSVNPAFALKYRDQATLETIPSPLGLSGVRYFRPDINGDGNAADVLEASTGEFHFVFQGTTLYVAVKSDDQALSDGGGEGSGDGFRLVFDRVDTLRASDGMPFQARFDFFISGGDTLQFGGDVGTYMQRYPGFLQAAFETIGTVDSPGNVAAVDIDDGWTIELAIDLKALGYSEDLGNNMLYVTPGFFDADYFQDNALSYSTRTWFGRERGQQGVPIFAFMDESMVLRGEREGVIGQDLVLLGARPNPSSGATVVHYNLPESGDVSIDVYDLLGRRVASVDAGVQGPGAQRAPLDAEALAAGLYLYRVNVRGVAGTTHTATGRLVLAR